MIDIISNIGKFSRNNHGEKELIDIWQKPEKDFDSILEVDIDTKNNSINVISKEFDKRVFRDSLFYQVGNGHVGSLVKIEKFKDDQKVIEKINKKIESSLKFLSIKTEFVKNISEKVFEKVRIAPSKAYIVSFLKDGKKPIDLFLDKFNNEIEKTYLNKTKFTKECHICGKSEIIYDTAIYNCYTNDKEIYSNTKGFSFGICKECLLNILHGRDYTRDYLSTYWADSEVMILPHNYDNDIDEIFKGENIGSTHSESKLINKLKSAEEEIFEEFGRLNEPVDIVFFEDPKASSEWKIIYHIRGILPSRFKLISDLEKKYSSENHNFRLRDILNILAGGTSSNESKRLLNMIFHGKKYSRSLFFNKVLKSYQKNHFSQKKIPDWRFMANIHSVYNFLVDCNCLNKGWNFKSKNNGGGYEMTVYATIDEFFEKNNEFFDTNQKKAWFLIGNVYSSLIYYSKKYHDSNVSYLEKNFFFGKKYDYKTFIYFTNKCSDLIIKYKSGGALNSGYSLNSLLIMAKEYIGTGKNLPTADEAKYIFFWGMQQRIGKKEKNEDTLTNEGEQ
ncbi:CRISPR-associated protein, TM1802 family [Methanococcus vannielii SB]|jgi:CRISPR-associated protein Csh1|uniref:CRISPR-associated protein, TM1802 family n=1 Tax=Methanococcus vannielii (strain ATCC 35089 / DSM 1224 / JCM 13029 / OCM 148 / SB) TaxID=406327 RepID=A6UNR7_METVS|nr:TIGR02556 family CRISPR-associated protein [Methanococcus vannielii]ABR54139.1 CRISPR-associated protein, TM1802 family [Methanococcus vannielii SB]